MILFNVKVYIHAHVLTEWKNNKYIILKRSRVFSPINTRILGLREKKKENDRKRKRAGR